MEHEAIRLARQIIELDIKRDEIWERFIERAGYQNAYKLLRNAQNGLIEEEKLVSRESVSIE